MLAAVSPLVHFARWWLRLDAATTQTTRSERDALARHARDKRHLVEIGVWHGVTTKRLRAVMSPQGELWAVDPYARGRLGVSFPELIARNEVDAIENGRVRWIKTTGKEAAERWGAEGHPPAEFVFVDGDHSWDGIRTDWESWSGHVASGGVIALHDSRSTPARPIEDAGSVRYTNEVIRSDPRYRVIDEVDSLTVLERVG
jgi:predicted O-methyltransferase YrrM